VRLVVSLALMIALAVVFPAGVLLAVAVGALVVAVLT
jgi:hypothetical protein